jgi:hypothetical protein
MKTPRQPIQPASSPEDTGPSPKPIAPPIPNSATARDRDGPGTVASTSTAVDAGSTNAAPSPEIPWPTTTTPALPAVAATVAPSNSRIRPISSPRDAPTRSQTTPAGSSVLATTTA